MIDITENLLASINPMRKMNENMLRITNPMHDMQESMRLVTSNIGDTHSLYSNSTQEFAKQIEAITNPLDSLQKQMEIMYDPMKEIQKQMDSLTSPTSSLMKQVNTLHQTAQAFQKNMASIGLESFILHNKLASDSTGYRRLIDTLSLKMAGSLASMNIKDIADSIKAREEAYNNIIASPAIKEVHNTTIVSQFDMVQSNIIEALEASNTTLEAQLEEMQAQIIAQENPFLLIVFMNVILPILVSLIFEFEIKPMIEPFYKHRVSPSVLKKEITKSVYEYIQDPEMRQRVRFVTANTLNIREGASKKTKTIGKLHLGELVELLKKEKNWCYIRRYNKQDETYVEGWAYTRYLTKVR